MALFEGTLEDALGRKADTEVMGIEADAAKRRRKAIAMSGHSGRLGSGVEDYTLGDLDADEASDIGGVYGGLAEALGGIPAEDYVSGRENNRSAELARLIGSLNRRKKGLMGILGGAGSGAAIGGQFGGGVGAGIGGGLGAILGGLS